MAKRGRVSVQLIVRRGASRPLSEAEEENGGPASRGRRGIAGTQERRRATGECGDDERRKADRRQKPPFTWELSDFVVVEKPRRRQKK